MICFPWGKLSNGLSHHLAHHCADVAACFEVISELPVIRARLETAAERNLDSADISRLTLFAFLHDLGKLHPEFQMKAFPDRKSFRRGHSAEGLAAFYGGIDAEGLNEKISSALFFDQLSKWADDETLYSLVMAVFSHHGRPVVTLSDDNSANWHKKFRQLESYDIPTEVHKIGKLLPIWFPQAFGPVINQLPSTSSFQHLFCGLLSLADWIGSDLKSCQFLSALDYDYIQKARNHAKVSINAIGLNSVTTRQGMVGTDFTDIAPGRTPRNAQAMIGDWPVDDHLIILEAETGSGKTEAALWRFARLFKAGKVDSLYFAVPTRAAANQIHGRIHTAMKTLFGKHVPQTVLAIPGYMKAGAVEGHALPDFKVLWDDNDIHTVRWAAENSRRFLAAPVAVGTVDQAMLAGLEVKHAHLRGAALSRSLLVIDEVHASDAYMTEVQKNLLDIHIGYGGHAMLMSATLGSAARNQWLGTAHQYERKLKEEQEIAYPAIWGKTAVMKKVDLDGRKKIVKMVSSEDWSASNCAAMAIMAARENAKVLVIRNTVNAAIETFNAIQQQGASDLLPQFNGYPVLHHSRFAVEDRRRLDDIVESVLSPDNNTRPASGLIVIGTQTLEQSLDICADYLISDLCPADVLLQRIGRLHRHLLKRPPGYEMPQCIVLSPTDGLGKFTSGNFFEYGLGKTSNDGGVYLNLHSCELTRRMVKTLKEWVIPDMNRYLVEGATHLDAVDSLNNELGKDWREYWNQHGGNEIAKRQAGNHVNLDVTLPFFRNDGSEFKFSDNEAKIRTRLGAQGICVKFAEGTVGPFGQPVSEIVCPAYWNVSEPEDSVELQKNKGILAFQLMTENHSRVLLEYGTRGLCIIK